MTHLLEFFIPSRVRDLEDPAKTGSKQFHITEPCEFDVVPRQQLDDLTRLFDCIYREKSPTALFARPELFIPLYSYLKAMDNPSSNEVVTRQARHKICHEISERLKKLLQVCVTYLKKKAESDVSDALLLCLRSTVRMYVFIICNVLLSSAPQAEDEENPTGSSQRSVRKRKRGRSEQEAGIGEDTSGVDQDGRELALTAVIDLFSPDLSAFWGDSGIETSMLTLIHRMILHMITQKANVQNDAQSVSGALAVLLLKVSGLIVTKGSVEPCDFVSSSIELALKTEHAAQFLTRFVSEAEGEEMLGAVENKVIVALFEGMASASIHDVLGDAGAAKNLALFFSEVARKCVSVTFRMSRFIAPTISSESYEVRKAVITCFTEMIIQKYTGPSRRTEDEEEIRDKYLSEMLFRVMDCNPFMRNHTLHMWEKLVEARAVPKRFHLAVTDSTIGRLEDRNYLVRDSALQVITCILRKNWFGHVLSCSLVQEKLDESKSAAVKLFDSNEEYTTSFNYVRGAYRPIEDGGNELIREEDTREDNTTSRCSIPDVQYASLNRVVFYEKALEFARLMSKALVHATSLLESRTERDAIEAIKLIVACNEYRIERADEAFLRVLVMIFEGELKIQCAVRDAFIEVIFTAFARSSTSSLMRNTASAQKLICLFRGSTEGEISAVERIFGLIKSNPSLSRLLSGQFMDAIWGIAEGSLDFDASIVDRRTAMRLFSLLCKHDWQELRRRRENVVDFLLGDTANDNVLLAYCLRALQCEAQDPHYQPIPSSCIPSEHVLLKEILYHICRKTTVVNSWLVLADAAVNAIHNLCEVPALVYTYVLDYMDKRVDSNTDRNALTQLFFLVGHTVLKQLVSVDSAERQQLRKLDVETMSKKTNHGSTGQGEVDAMHKELGLGSHEYRRHAIQELSQRRKDAIMAEGSIWNRLSKYVVAACKQKGGYSVDGNVARVCAVLALSKLMVVSEKFCEENLHLLFDIASDKRESWVVKTNTVIALGDLACVHPNLLGSYLKVPTKGLFKLLNDDDLRVRAVTIQVCSHLVLCEMLRIRDHLYAIVKLVADPDETIANNAVIFVQNLALKEKEKTGNLIPPLVSQLSNAIPPEKFQLAMRSLLERVEGDKPTESLIDRLCQRFESFSERSKKKRQIARNVAFCLYGLNYTTEKPIKKITSEVCYQQYKHWLRDEVVLDFFKGIATKSKKVGQRAGNERRDKAAIEEWELRIQADSCSLEAVEEDVRSKGSLVVRGDTEVESGPSPRNSDVPSRGGAYLSYLINNIEYPQSELSFLCPTLCGFRLGTMKARIVPEDFEFEKSLGTGAFSKVMVARYVPTGIRYAVKLISKRQILTAPTDEEKARMANVARRETRMLLMCNHPNIVKFHASLQTPDDLMYVMELCDGGELLHAIKARQKLPLDAARYALSELLSAVWYLHHAPKQTSSSAPNAPLKTMTILHRDIKPENIMLSYNKHVKLIDFGTAVACQSVDERPEGENTTEGRAQTFCGTTHYMSPELLQDNYTCTASDYWACGCVLYHMLVGKRPFDKPTEYLLIKSILDDEPQFPPDIDKDAQDLISKLLIKNPDRRIDREGIQAHPFLSGVDFENLANTDVERFWTIRSEWVDDSKVTSCKDCGGYFRFWRRKHHCRKCGYVFCSSCSSWTSLIPDSIYTEPERVCDKCFNEIRSAF